MPKSIIVTGASRGIGLAICRYLVENGHNVLMVARSSAPLEDFRSQHPERVRVLAGDCSQLELASLAVKTVVSEFGSLEGLVINHGILAPVTRLADCNIDDWKKNFDTNFFGALAFVRAAIPALRKSKGSIIFNSSGAAISHYATWGSYGASKAAMNHLAGTVAVEEKEIITLAIAPGVVDTDMQKELRDNHLARMEPKDADRFVSLHAEGKLLKPDQPGNVMARLTLDPPRELSGQFLRWNAAELADFQDK